MATESNERKIKKCDFCTANEDAKWSYQCGDFTNYDIGVRFTAEWLACELCSEMIDQENLQGLVDRAYETYLEHHGVGITEDVKSRLKKLIFQTHLEFYKKRTQWRKEEIKRDGEDKGGV